MTVYIVYKITNLVNGKIYVGKHVCNHVECNYFGSGTMLKAAIKKYGRENFVKEIMFTFDTKDEMNAKEIEIVTEEFVASDDNYNMRPGGDGGNTFGGRHHSAETKRKIGESRVGIGHSIETKMKLIELRKDRKPFSGRRHSEETKRKMSEAKKRKSLSS